MIRAFMLHNVRLLQTFQNLQREDDIFKEIVTREIEYFKAQGKRTDLLEKTLRSE